jgi:hypothetical protein
VSRLAPLDEGDLPAQARKPGKVLRSRRQRPLHPEQIADMLRAKAAGTSAEIGFAPHGLLVIVTLDDQWGPNGFPKRIVRELLPGATLDDARRTLDAELRLHGPRNAWIVAKSRPDQKTVRP